MRRPNTLTSETNSHIHNIHARGATAASDHDDESSLCSQSSRASSLYVDPVSWNDASQWTQAANRRLDEETNKSTPYISKNKTAAIGRGSALSSRMIGNSTRQVSGVNADQVRRPFGRGTLIQTVNKYHTSIR